MAAPLERCVILTLFPFSITQVCGHSTTDTKRQDSGHRIRAVRYPNAFSFSDLRKCVAIAPQISVDKNVKKQT